jgi:hypothetical protein
MKLPRQCSLCGRKGTRSFVNPGGAPSMPVICKYERACHRRRRAWLNSFKRTA